MAWEASPGRRSAGVAFVGLPVDAPFWHPTTFTKHRDRLLAGDIAAAFLTAVVRPAQQRRLLSGEHYTVDGTLLEAWASQKSFQPRTGPGDDRDDDPLELHHKRPLAEGGSNARQNLVQMTRTEHRLGENYRRNHDQR